MSHSQELHPVQSGTVSKVFIPSYYVQVFQLAKHNFSDKEIAKRMKPPVRYTTLSVWKKKDPDFADAITQGRNQSGQVEPTFSTELTDSQKKFLIAYVYEGTISAAARVVPCDRSRHHMWITEANNREAYAQAFENAKAAHSDFIYATVRQRAVDGHRKYKFTAKGEPVYIECDSSDPEAKQLTDSEGKLWWGKHYYENTRSDMLLCRLAEYVIPGFRADPTTINNNNSNTSTNIDIGKLVDELEEGRKTNVMTVDAVAVHAQKLIEKLTEGTTDAK